MRSGHDIKFSTTLIFYKILTLPFKDLKVSSFGIVFLASIQDHFNRFGVF